MYPRLILCHWDFIRPWLLLSNPVRDNHWNGTSCLFFPITYSLQCRWLIFKEAICTRCSNKIDDEVVNGAVTCFSYLFPPLLLNVSRPERVNQTTSASVSLIDEKFPVKRLFDRNSHILGILVAHVCGGQHKCNNFFSVITGSWSWNPWHRLFVSCPSLAVPLKTLLAYRLILRQTATIAESAKVISVHLPKALKLRKNISWKNTQECNSTKQMKLANDLFRVCSIWQMFLG